MLAAATAFCYMTLLLNNEKYGMVSQILAKCSCLGRTLHASHSLQKFMKQSTTCMQGSRQVVDITSLGMQLKGASARKGISASDHHTLSSLWHTSLYTPRPTARCSTFSSCCAHQSCLTCSQTGTTSSPLTQNDSQDSPLFEQRLPPDALELSNASSWSGYSCV